MTETSFYILKTDQPRDRYIVACRVAEKAYKLGQQVFILADSTDQIMTLDNLLWSFRQGSFVPHLIVDEEAQDISELIPNVVKIGTNSNRHSATVLINLTVQIPDNFERYERIAEIVDQDEQIKQAGRQRYKTYQAKNIDLKTHKL